MSCCTAEASGLSGLGRLGMLDTATFCRPGEMIYASAKHSTVIVHSRLPTRLPGETVAGRRGRSSLSGPPRRLGGSPLSSPFSPDFESALEPFDDVVLSLRLPPALPSCGLSSFAVLD